MNEEIIFKWDREWDKEFVGKCTKIKKAQPLKIFETKLFCEFKFLILPSNSQKKKKKKKKT